VGVRRLVTVSAAILVLTMLAACGQSAPTSVSSNSSPTTFETIPPATTTSTTALPQPPPRVSSAFLRPGFGVVSIINADSPSGSLLEATTDFVHWRNITPPVPPRDKYGDPYAFGAISFLNSLNGWVVAGWPGSVAESVLFRTTNGGRSWRKESNSFDGEGFGDVSPELVTFANARDGWRVVISIPGGGGGSFWVTNKGGATWRRIPIAHWRPPSVNLLTFSSTKHGFAAQSLPPTGYNNLAIADYSPLYETTDGGQTWQPRTLPMPPGFTGAQTLYSLPTFLKDGAGILPVALFEGSSTFMAFYGSSDGGTTWSMAAVASTSSIPTSSYAANETQQLPAVAVADLSTWWVIGGVGPGSAPTVRVTDDGGHTWTTVVSSGLPADISGASDLSGV
jgi:photosystem II stability/assembly factor-like uncharacterized protein